MEYSPINSNRNIYSNNQNKNNLITLSPLNRTSTIKSSNHRRSSILNHKNRPKSTENVIFDPNSTFFKASLPCGEHTTKGMAFMAGHDPEFYEEDPKNLITIRPTTNMGVRDTWNELAKYSKLEPIDEYLQIYYYSNTRVRRNEWNEIQKEHDKELHNQAKKEMPSLVFLLYIQQYFDPHSTNPFCLSIQRAEEMKHKKIGIEINNEVEKPKSSNLVPISMWIAAHTRNQIRETLEKRKEITRIEQEKLKKMMERQEQITKEYECSMQKKKEEEEEMARKAEEDRKARKQARLEKKLAKLTPFQKEEYLRKLESRQKRSSRSSRVQIV